MMAATWDLLDAEFERFPVLRGAADTTRTEIDRASREIGIAFQQDYAEFVRRYGAAIVGAYPIFGLRKVDAMGLMWSVIDANLEYRSKLWPGINEWLIVSSDLAGNPVGISRDESIWLSDHDFGDIVPIAESFEGFVRKYCLKV